MEMEVKIFAKYLVNNSNQRKSVYSSEWKISEIYFFLLAATSYWSLWAGNHIVTHYRQSALESTPLTFIGYYINWNKIPSK
jgi:hypothetical protein